MLHQDPGEERVFLTAYERQQLELIEQGLANEDPRQPREAGSGDRAEPRPIWVASPVGCAWVVLLGVVVTSAWLVVLGSAGASGALARYLYERRRFTAEN